jgi:hypothetical protein
MEPINKIFALKLLGCEITEDTGRYYAKGGFVKKYQDINHWVNINNVIVDWNFAIELAKVIYDSDNYEDCATFFDNVFMAILDAGNTPEITVSNLLLAYHKPKENFGGMEMYDKSKNND